MIKQLGGSLDLGATITHIAKSNHEKTVNNKCDLGQTDSDVVLRSLNALYRERVEVENALVNCRLEFDLDLVIKDVL